jgi:GrpB-like predicted nucleotidyltransferase (UPF0157 family)
MMESLADKVARVLRDEVSIVPYDPCWPAAFEAERDHLLACLPPGLITRIEHFGSTAVPGLVAKPVIDLLIETPDLNEIRQRVAPLLAAQGYDYFWRPTHGDDGPPWYAWLIKRDATGQRTHHLHIVEPGFPQWEGLRFRDLLRCQPALAQAYGELKLRLADAFCQDRVAYTAGKRAFIENALNGGHLA